MKMLWLSAYLLLACLLCMTDSYASGDAKLLEAERRAKLQAIAKQEADAKAATELAIGADQGDGFITPVNPDGTGDVASFGPDGSAATTGAEPAPGQSAPRRITAEAPETCACSTFYNGPFSEKPTAAFLGRVIERRGHYDGRIYVRMEVHSAWGNDYPKADKLFTVAQPKDICHFDFQMGEIYLVDPTYLKRRMFAADQCTRTKSVDSAQKDLEILGEPLYSYEHKQL